jgi:hypothetical protein
LSWTANSGEDRADQLVTKDAESGDGARGLRRDLVATGSVGLHEGPELLDVETRVAPVEHRRHFRTEI